MADYDHSALPEGATREVLTGRVRYFFLRKISGGEDVRAWPPSARPLDVPANKICDAVRLYASKDGWRAECAEKGAPPSSDEPAFVLTRNTAFALLQDGKRTKADAALLGVRVVNLNEKGVEYATHLMVRALAGFGFGAPRRPVVVPIDRMVLGEYVERGQHAEAGLDLRVTPAEFTGLTPYLPDNVIRRLAQSTLDTTVLSTARFYSYGTVAKHGITLEVEAGRVPVLRRGGLPGAGEQGRAGLLARPRLSERAASLRYMGD